MRSPRLGPFLISLLIYLRVKGLHQAFALLRCVTKENRPIEITMKDHPRLVALTTQRSHSLNLRPIHHHDFDALYFQLLMQLSDMHLRLGG